ncbi:MAG: 2-iminoacetate synthase ThiH [Brevinematales bacterium]|nr:2-iminoacetate synthase ThiH [Brevinematales bacterium]
MSFLNVIESYNIDFEKYEEKLSFDEIKKSIYKEKKSEFDYLNLLSYKAGNFLEEMAKEAQKITFQYFGKTIQLYAPLYISDYCTNSCIYCGFSALNKIKRQKLTLKEIEENAKEIAKTGIKHILFLTGEAPEITPMEYLLDTVKILKKYFSSISIEIFPMNIEDYKKLAEAGVDGLTIYQETYDRKIYDSIHLAGKKKDYVFRLDTPERGAIAGFRRVNIGALYGLADPLKDAFFSGLHARYLQDKYIDTEISISFPRINPAEGNFQPKYHLDDKRFVQFICAFRLFLPRCGITISTRENARMRDNLIGLGITRMSAGSKTSVGGYKYDNLPSQFEISDSRSVFEIEKVIWQKGYEPVFKDWHQF